jgi:hypothetical protein
VEIDEGFGGSGPIRTGHLPRLFRQAIGPVEFATRVMVIVDLATRSMWEGKAWDFDPVTLEATPA